MSLRSLLRSAGIGGGASLSADALSIDTTAAQGAAVAALSQPFGAGTTFTIVSQSMAALTLSGRQLLRTSTALGSGTIVQIKIRATSADGKREVAETLSLIGVTPAPPPGGTPEITAAPELAIAGTVVSVTPGIATAALSHYLVYAGGVPLVDDQGAKIPLASGDTDLAAHAVQLGGQDLQLVADAGSGVRSLSNVVTFPVQGFGFESSGLPAGMPVSSISGLLTAGSVQSTVGSDGKLHGNNFGNGYLLHDFANPVIMEVVWAAFSGASYGLYLLGSTDNSSSVVCVFNHDDTTYGGFTLTLNGGGQSATNNLLGFVVRSGDTVRVEQVGPHTLTFTNKTHPTSVTVDLSTLDGWSSLVPGPRSGLAALPIYDTGPFLDVKFIDGATAGAVVTAIDEPITGFTISGRSVTLGGNYTSSAPTVAEVVGFNHYGDQLFAPVPLDTIPTAGTIASTALLPLDASYSGHQVPLAVRLKNESGAIIAQGVRTATLGTRAPITPLRIGVNIGVFWKEAPMARNRFEQADARCANYQILNGSAWPTGPASAGAYGDGQPRFLLPMDASGAITGYPTDGTGSVTPNFVFQLSLPVGTWDVAAPAGMIFSFGLPGQNAAQATWDATSITVTAAGKVLVYVGGTIPAIGMRVGFGDPQRNLTCLLRGDPHPERRFLDAFIADLASIASYARWLGPLATNDTRTRELTSGDGAFNGIWGMGGWGIPIKAIADAHNQIKAVHGKAVAAWLPMTDQVDDAGLTEAMTILEATADASIDFEFEETNELWNTYFAQYGRMNLNAYVNGFSATAPTPQTVQTLPLDGNRVPTINIAPTSVSNIKWLVYTSGADYLGVWIAKQAVTAGDTNAAVPPALSGGHQETAYWRCETSDADPNGMGGAAHKYKAALFKKVMNAANDVFDRSRLTYHWADAAIADPVTLFTRLADNGSSLPEVDEASVGAYPDSMTGNVAPGNYDADKHPWMADFTCFDPASIDATKQRAFLTTWYGFAKACIAAKYDSRTNLRHTLAALGFSKAFGSYEGHPVAGGSDGVWHGWPNGSAANAMVQALYLDATFDGTSFTATGLNRMQDVVTYEIQQKQQREGGPLGIFAFFNGKVSDGVSSCWVVQDTPGVDTAVSLALKAAQAKVAAGQSV